jgi:signal transduction histidine kinase
MKRWLADTLFKRLFALMWLALVVSHLVAFLVVTHDRAWPPGAQLPTFPSLPPFPRSTATPPPGEPQRAGSGPARDDRADPAPDRHADGMDGPGGPDGMARGGPRGPGGPGDRGRPGLDDLRDFGGPPPLPGATPGRSGSGGSPDGIPAGVVALDYLIRFAIIGLAAWLGARWLSRPMRELSTASRSLGAALARGEPTPRLAERAGTIEVRETARVFNEMSGQLAEQVNGRALLVAAISHDLRTPLTRIRMRLEAHEDDPLAQRSIADIREMDELIESALEVFRGPGHQEPAQVTDVLALVQSFTDDLADLGQPVTVAGTPALARVHPAAARRVVANLVNNALRYGQRADVRVGVAGDEVEIVVDDTGPGIPPAQLEAVTRPFFRLETSRNRLTGGSGLGLYIARDLVTREGGTLALANRPEGGLRARIALPKA